MVAAGFGHDAEALRRRLAPELRARPLVDGDERDGDAVSDAGADAVLAALDAWSRGNVAALDAVPTAQRGTAFRRAVWDQLRAIPAGTTVSYGALAARLASPGATRAVGTACGANLVAPFIPCHRVVRADGTLGGYAYGLAVKRWLLEHERATAPTLPTCGDVTPL